MHVFIRVSVYVVVSDAMDGPQNAVPLNGKTRHSCLSLTRHTYKGLARSPSEIDGKRHAYCCQIASRSPMSQQVQGLCRNDC